MTKNQATDLYLSVACGCLAMVRNNEKPGTRRFRKLADIEGKIMDLLYNEFPAGFTDKFSLEFAANTISAIECAINADVDNMLNDGSE